MVEKKEEVFNWPPLESDPQILMDYMHKLGMSKSWEIAEVIGLEPEFLPLVPSDSVAFILAYDFTGDSSKKEEIKKSDPEVDFYMWQTRDLDNACGLIACLHAVLNNLGKVTINPGSHLEKFIKMTEKKSPEERAKILNDFHEIQEAHKAYGEEGQSAKVESCEDTKYHFICFTINKKGQLVELDGIAGEPILVKGIFIKI